MAKAKRPRRSDPSKHLLFVGREVSYRGFTIVACCDSCQHMFKTTGRSICSLANRLAPPGSFLDKRCQVQGCGWCGSYQPINYEIADSLEILNSG